MLTPSTVWNKGRLQKGCKRAAIFWEAEQLAGQVDQLLDS